MNPEHNQQTPPLAPASLPVVPQASQPSTLAPQSQAAAVQPANLTEAVSMQAKELVKQYQHDPYRLSGALQQLKAQYLADQFHITTKTVDE